jgi:2'-5' RNA ligase
LTDGASQKTQVSPRCATGSNDASVRFRVADMAITGLIVEVPQAEETVGSLRQRFDASASLGVPAHITVLAPFMAPELITDRVMAQISVALQGVAPFEFSLARVGRFATTAYLAPEPPEPFIELTTRLVRNFPAYPAYGGEFSTIVPHLTVAHGDAEWTAIAEAELMSRLEASNPIRSLCTAVDLLEDSTGHWKRLVRFELGNNSAGL